jgi:hypothetical protein
MKKLLEYWWYNTLYHFNVKMDKNKIPEGYYCYIDREVIGADGTPTFPYVKTYTCPYYRKYKDGTVGCMFIANKGNNSKLRRRKKICGVNMPL